MADSISALNRLSELMRRVNSSSNTSDVLEEIVTGVVEVLGYGVAAISHIEGETLVMSHVAAPPEARQQLLGRRTPAARVLDEYQQADRWGILRFIPAGRMTEERRRTAWIPSIEPLDAEDAWHPEDALYAPLYSASGELLGNMAVDLPPGHRIPSQSERDLLEMFAVQAGLALSHARERDLLTERLRMVEMLNKIGHVSSAGGLNESLESAAATLVGTLGAVQAWIRCYPDESRGIEHGAGFPRPLQPEEDIPTLRRDLVRSEDVTEPVVLGVDDESSEVLQRSWQYLQTVLRWLDAHTAVVLPLTVSGELLGYAVIAFRDRQLSRGELAAVAQLGRELGRIVQQARLLATEQRLVQELRELARYRRELIATISHELKTPLTSILGNAELLQERFPDVSALGAIERNAQRLNVLVNNLLEYSRLQTVKSGRVGEVDLVDICTASAGLLEIRASQVGVHLDLHHPEEPVIVSGDGEEIGRVVDNLIDNAIKYTPKGGRVTVTVEQDESDARVVVADTGVGVDPADLPHLFRAFHRSTVPEVLSIPGTGLGLPIAQRIAQSHGGDIDVVSVRGEGSTFTLRLPLSTPPAPAG